MTAPDSFLSRWSRRKLEADRRDQPGASAAPLEEKRPATPGQAPTIAVSIGDDALSAEELAALPRIEDLTAATDLAPFMRAGVPALLRNAALRRMWLLDPAIRDFVGEARDYSYDWNVPGGVPVSGPLLPTDDVETTLAGLFSRGPNDEQAEDPGEASVETKDDPPPGPVRPEGSSPDASEGRQSDVAADTTDEPAGLEQEEFARPEPALARPAATPFAEPAAIRRRHGAAIPKLDSF